MSNNIFFFLPFGSHLTVGQCVCMCVLGVLVLGCFLYKTVRRKSFCFWKTLCKYCWWKINICCTLSFHLSLEMMKKTMIFMNNSGDVDDAEADYTCPSWIRAFDVRCIFVGGVVRSGQEKPREGVIPNTSQAHCSSTATYLTPPAPHTPPGNWLCDMWRKYCSLCYSCHKTLLCFCYKRRKQSAPRLCERTVQLPVESLCPGRLASHLGLSAYRLGDLL